MSLFTARPAAVSSLQSCPSKTCLLLLCFIIGILNTLALRLDILLEQRHPASTTPSFPGFAAIVRNASCFETRRWWCRCSSAAFIPGCATPAVNVPGAAPARPTYKQRLSGPGRISTTATAVRTAVWRTSAIVFKTRTSTAGATCKSASWIAGAVLWTAPATFQPAAIQRAALWTSATITRSTWRLWRICS